MNRAIEQDFLSFRTGDLTMLLDNADGELDAVFAALGPKDRWHLRVSEDGSSVFAGVVLPQGSVRLDRAERTVELTVFGATRVLQDISAEGVKRALGPYTVTTATSGQSSITLNTTAGLLPSDQLEVTDQVNRETITIKQVTSLTQATLDAALGNSYASGTPLTHLTPWHRFKSADFLVRELLKTAKLAVAEILTSNVGFKSLTPSAINSNVIPVNLWPSTFITFKDGKTHVAVGDNADVGDGIYTQLAPEDDWIFVESMFNNTHWVDWTIYRKISDGEPPLHVRSLQIHAQEGLGSSSEHPKCYKFAATAAGIRNFRTGVATAPDPDEVSIFQSITADPSDPNWGATTELILLYTSNSYNQTFDYWDNEYDPVRDQVWATWSTAGGAKHTKIYDVASDLLVAGFDLTTGALFGPRYVPEWDAVVGLVNDLPNVGDNHTGPWKMVAYRGTTKLWERTGVVPNFLVRREDWEGKGDGTLANTLTQQYPTKSLRVYNGRAFMLVVSDKKLQGMTSDDEFVTATRGDIAAASSVSRYAAGWDGKNYRGIGFDGTQPKVYFLASEQSSGIVGLADFTNKSVAEALGELAVLTNSVFWVDDDLQAHFVARDRIRSGDVPRDLTGQMLAQSDVEIWSESRQYVRVSGGAFAAEAGDKDFRADRHDVSAEFLPNGMFAQALAQSYLDFYSKRRRSIEGEVPADGQPFMPMDRIFVGAARHLVHESDHDLGERRARLVLLEDLEGS